MIISKNYTANLNVQKNNSLPTFSANLKFLPEIIGTSKLEAAFKNATEEVDGVVTLIKNGDFFDLQYKNGETCLSRKTILSESILDENNLYSTHSPLRGAVVQIVANVDDMLAKNGFGYGGKNSFTKIFDKLLNLPFD